MQVYTSDCNRGLVMTTAEQTGHVRRRALGNETQLQYLCVVGTSHMRKYENVHILLWLIKDLSWAMTWKGLGLSMILPTVIVALYVCYKTREFREEFYVNLAVVFWISANSFWMVVEFAGHDEMKLYAAFPFIAGLLSVGYHYGRSFLARN